MTRYVIVYEQIVATAKMLLKIFIVYFSEPTTGTRTRHGCYILRRSSRGNFNHFVGYTCSVCACSTYIASSANRSVAVTANCIFSLVRMSLVTTVAIWLIASVLLLQQPSLGQSSKFMAPVATYNIIACDAHTYVCI